MDILIAHMGNRGFIIVFAIGLFAGGISALAGGRTLLSVSILLLFNIPPITAIASSKFASLGFPLGALKRYWSTGEILWRWIPIFTVLAVTGGYIGSHALINIPEHILLPGVAIVLLLLAPLLFLLGDIGEIQHSTTRNMRGIGYVLYIVAAIYGGLFGGGAGIMVMYICLFFFGFTILQIKASNIIPWFLLNLTATFVFYQQGFIDFSLGIPLCIGMALGGYIGVHIAIKKGNRRLKYIIAGFIIVSSVRLLRPYLIG